MLPVSSWIKGRGDTLAMVMMTGAKVAPDVLAIKADTASRRLSQEELLSLVTVTMNLLP